MNIVSDVQAALRSPVTSPAPDTYTGVFEFAADHPVFGGHFPKYPLVPGVYLLQSLWLVLSLGRGFLPALQGVRTTRFQAQVIPPCQYQALVILETGKKPWVARGEVIFAGQVAAQAVFELAEPTAVAEGA
jgi:3-hydroxymyristoyl/3-hydroxydecanoyl-(acyl carrier protein) dehydratase